MSQGLDNIKNEYSDRVNAILSKLGIDYSRSKVSKLNPFDVAFEFFNASPRLGADSLKESLVNVGATTQEPASLPEFLSATKISGNWALKNWYLRRTEPLINDRVFILISNHENDIKAQLKKAATKEEKAELAKKLAEIKAEKNAYMEYMDKYRVALLEETRNDFIDRLIKQAEGDPKTQEKLEKLKAISLNTPSGKKGSLQSRADCLESYGLHKDILNELEKNSNISKEDLSALGNLCNHHNDVAYLKPQTYTKLEIFFAALKAIVPILGLIILIVGALGLIPSFGASSPMLAVGVGLVLSPAVIEGVGHAIHAAFRRRAPDTFRMIMMGVSIVIGSLGFIVAAVGPSIALIIESPHLIKLTKELIAASTLIPSAIVSQLYAAPRQTLKDFALNFFAMPANIWDFVTRVQTATGGTHAGAHDAATMGAEAAITDTTEKTVVAQPQNKVDRAAKRSITAKSFIEVNLLLKVVDTFINLVKAALRHPKIESTLFKWGRKSQQIEKPKAIMPAAEEKTDLSKTAENKVSSEQGEQVASKTNGPHAKKH